MVVLKHRETVSACLVRKEHSSYDQLNPNIYIWAVLHWGERGTRPPTLTHFPRPSGYWHKDARLKPKRELLCWARSLSDKVSTLAGPWQYIHVNLWKSPEVWTGWVTIKKAAVVRLEEINRGWQEAWKRIELLERRQKIELFVKSYHPSSFNICLRIQPSDTYFILYSNPSSPIIFSPLFCINETDYCHCQRFCC